MYINVPGKLNMVNCKSLGMIQGAFVRGGTANIKNSTITLNYPDNDAQDMADYFNKRNWGSGNMLNLAALTVGNKVDGPYNYPTNVTLVDTKLETVGDYASYFPALYSWANSGEGKGVTLTFIDNCTFNSEKGIIYGDNARNTTVVEKRTVSFDNEGSKTSVAVVKGEKVTKPNDPIKEGYTFLGWYLGYEKYDFTKPVTEKMTLTAKYKIIPGETTVEAPIIDTKEPVKEVTVGVKTDKETETTLEESVDTTLKTKIDNAVNEGKDVETLVNVEKIDVTQANTETKKDITKVEDTAKDKQLKIAEYLDLSILVVSNGVELGKITETKKPLTFQIAIPKELKKEGRVFQVVRVHDGVVTVLNTKEENGILTFKTDKFSTYALVYTDNTTTGTATKKPIQTSDNINTTLYASICGLTLVGAFVLLSRKEEL